MPKKRNEATGKKVASIAGRILRMLERAPDSGNVQIDGHPDGTQKYGFVRIANVKELRALAASALTQREDRVGYATLTTEIDGHRQTSKQPVVSNTISKKVTFRKPPKRKPARKGRK